jgi:hypothetical protein
MVDAHFLSTHIPLFRGLPPLQLLKIASEVEVRNIATGIHFSLGFLTPHPCAYLLSGFVVVKNPSNQVLPLGPYLFSSGDWILLHHNIVAERRPWVLEIYREATIITMPYAPILNLAQMNTQLAINLMQTTAAESLRLLSYSTSMQLLGVEGRLAYLLLYLAREVFHSKRFRIPINQLKLANLITTSREVVNRVFMTWRREGVITLAQHEVTILQREILEERCKFCS